MSNGSNIPEIYEDLTNTSESLCHHELNTSIPATQMILEVGGLMHSIKGDIAADARLLSITSSTVVGLTSNATNVINTYDEVQLAEHIRMHKALWHFSFPYEVPVFAFLFGTSEYTPKPQQKKSYRPRRSNTQVVGSVKGPENVDRVRNNAEPEAASELNKYLKTCQNGECSYFHLILHPKSFTRTIENIYNVSTLIKDNKVGIYIDADTELPFLKCVKKDKDKPSSERKQFIQTIDKKQWSDLIEALRITEPLRRVEEDDNMSDENQS